jgi:hypothetical protein
MPDKRHVFVVVGWDHALLVSRGWYFVWRPPWSIWFLFVTCLAIILPKADKEAADLLGLCLLCVTVVSGLTVPALCTSVAMPSSPSSRRPGLVPVLFRSRRSSSSVESSSALDYWNSRAKHFGRPRVTRVTSSLAAMDT